MPRLFFLTKYVNQDFNRSSGKTEYSDVTGLPVPSSTSVVTIKANIQPFSDSQTLMLDAAERTKEWIWVFAESEIRKMEEGAGGYDADTFTWQGKLYEVMQVKPYKMGVLDHWEAKACLASPTPRSS